MGKKKSKTVYAKQTKTTVVVTRGVGINSRVYIVKCTFICGGSKSLNTKVEGWKMIRKKLDIEVEAKNLDRSIQ